MSPLWYRIYDGMIDRGSATLSGVDGCWSKKLLTDDEHDQLLAKWHAKNDPPPAEPDPIPEPVEETEPVETSG